MGASTPSRSRPRCAATALTCALYEPDDLDARRRLGARADRRGRRRRQHRPRCAELAGRLGVPLAVIPTGTANDFARASELPLDPERGVRARRHGRASCARSSSGGSPTGARSSTSRAPASPRPRRTAPSRSSRSSARSPTRSARCARRSSEHPLRCAVRADGERGLRRRGLAGDRRGHRRLRRRLRDRRRRPRRRRARRHRAARGLAPRRSPAARGACAAARSPSSATCATLVAT